MDGEVVDEVELPKVFNVKPRIDVIRRAYLSYFTSLKQPQGRDPLAGKKVSVESFGTGREMARIPRHSSGRGGFAPMTRGGYKPHPPRVDEKIREKINNKEKKLAFLSALASTTNYELVVKRGHKFNKDSLKDLPIVFVDEVENLAHTREAAFLLQKIGVYTDVERVKEGIKIRAGKGKLRGRKLKRRVG
ncbi:MAG: 50S ribosomal protein L4, partial [Thermoprotei archaeon]